MDAFRRDLRFAARTLLRARGFSVVAALTLALGIGANTAIFSVVSGILIRPLGYPDGDRLVRILGYERGQDGRGTISYPNFADWRETARSFEGMAAFDEWRPTLTAAAEPERLEGASVNASYFRVLGVQPAVGRFFLPDEDEPDAPAAVVLSHGAWQRRFGGDPGVVGSTIELSGVPYEVVGVAPAGFEDPQLQGSSFGQPEIWRLPPGYFRTNSRGSRSFTAVARLREGVSLAEAQSEISTVMARLEAEYPEENANRIVRLVPLKETIVGPVRPALVILSVAVGLVLLVACANVANLALTRATARGREISVRAALGASRGALVRQLLVESVVLAAVGGALGVLLASMATDALSTMGATDLPRLEGVTVNGGVLAFAAGVTLLTAVLFGLAPAIQVSRADLAGRLREGGRGGSPAPRQRRVREVLVGAEVALSVMLLVGAGLLGRSLLRLQSVDPGIDTAGVLTLQVDPLSDEFGDDASLTRLYRAIEERIAAVPGVEDVGAIDILPLSGSFNGMGFTVEGRPEPPSREGPGAEVRAATPGYFATLGIPVVRGRGLAATDDADAARVIVINQALARQVWPGEDPVGQRIELDGPREIVGIVGDVHQFSLSEAPEPTLYLPHEQAITWMRRDVILTVRTATDPIAAAPAVRAAVWDVDTDVAISGVRSMDQVLADTLAQPRFRTFLLGLFAALAFVLGAIGIYGVIAYGVAQRVGELAVRLTLGARRVEIVGLVLRQGLAPVLIGLAVGMAAAIAGGRLLAGLLYGVSSADPVTLVGVPLVLLAVATLACWLPARRAARLDPAAVLRQQ